jgi:hypothetical protein
MTNAAAIPIRLPTTDTLSLRLDQQPETVAVELGGTIAVLEPVFEIAEAWGELYMVVASSVVYTPDAEPGSVLSSGDS